MNKQQAYNSFWGSFGVLAFEENSAPTFDEVKTIAKSMNLPTDIYIAYQVIIDDLGHPVYPTASIYSRSTSWEKADTLANVISRRIQEMNTIKLDNGRMFITKGSPFAQHQLESEDLNIRRVILNLGIEFFTEY